MFRLNYTQEKIFSYEYSASKWKCYVQSRINLKIGEIMGKLPNCVKCGSEFTYEDGTLYICPECGYEWMVGSEAEEIKHEQIVRDAHGNELKDGDSVVIIKDLKVKGASSALKIGVKIKNIHLVEEVNGHNIEVKVKGFGSMMLKSEFVKKST